MAFDDLVTKLAEQLDRSIVLYDADLALVAFSAHDDDIDVARRTVILSRKASGRARELMRTAGAHRARSAVVIERDDDTGTLARVVFPIRHNERLVGYIAYVHPDEGQPVPIRHADVLSDFAGDLGELLFEREVKREHDHERIAGLLESLISPSQHLREQAARRLLDLDAVGASRAYRVVVFSTDAYPNEISVHHRVAVDACLSSVLPKAPAKIVAARVLDLGVAVTPRAVDQVRLKAFLERPENAGIRAGFGDPCDRLEDSYRSYHQAVVAARGAWLDADAYAPIAGWSQLGFDRLFLQLPLQQLTADDLPRSVQQLVDTRSNADLITTLTTYLDLATDAQATARRLMIHRSTLYYRLDRIKKIAGVDLGHGPTLTELRTGLRAAELAGLLPD